MHEQRKKLGGYIPFRLSKFTDALNIPDLIDFEPLLKEQNKKISTTVAFVRVLNLILKIILLKIE